MINLARVGSLLQNSNRNPVPQLVLRRAGSRAAEPQLPTDSGGGDIEPGILPGTELPDPSGGLIQGTTQGGRIPSWGGRGPWAVESGGVEVDAGDHSQDPGPAVNLFQPLAGENWLGGRVLGNDPNTGKPIYDPLGYGNLNDLAGDNSSRGPGGGGGPGASPSKVALARLMTMLS